MVGSPPTAAKFPPAHPRPQTRSQSKSSQHTPPPTSSQKETASSKRATKAAPSKVSDTQPVASSPDSTTTQPQSPLSTIAQGIQNVIAFYKPPEQITQALAEILRYARKAVEEEAKGRAPGVSMTEVADKLSKSAEQLCKTAERMESATAEIHAKVTAVTSTSAQLETAAITYKDALLKIPSQLNHAGERNSLTDPAIGRSADRKTRQVLIDFVDDQMTALSITAIKEKVLDAIKKVTFPPPPKDVVIEEVTKLRNNGIIVLFKDKEVKEWLQSSETELLFTKSLGVDANIRPHQHVILVPKIPITLDPSNETHLREIEETNSLKVNSISKMRWIKPEQRRNPLQRLAHALLTLSSAEAANICIRDGLLIHGMKSYPSKMKQEPIQCLKCWKWGHYANQCLAPKDTCGTCGGDHWTNACTDPAKRHCASCNTNSHASWDRQCPEFLKRCEQFDESHPENALKYFPTEEPWTKVIRPPKIPFTDRFPAHFAVGSLPLPPPNRDKQREPLTRQITQHRKRRTPPHATGQTAITNYYVPSGSQVRTDNMDAEIIEEGETEDYSSAHSFSFEEAHVTTPPYSWN
jgi:hypothetical protein